VAGERLDVARADRLAEAVERELLELAVERVERAARLREQRVEAVGREPGYFAA
jgi:hypothetical protein